MHGKYRHVDACLVFHEACAYCVNIGPREESCEDESVQG